MGGEKPATAAMQSRCQRLFFGPGGGEGFYRDSPVMAEGDADLAIAVRKERHVRTGCHPSGA